MFSTASIFDQAVAICRYFRDAAVVLNLISCDADFFRGDENRCAVPCGTAQTRYWICKRCCNVKLYSDC